MENIKKNPKQKSSYPSLLNQFEKGRHETWLKGKLQTQKGSFGQNLKAKSFQARALQMFSGKRGK
jgi:hypothetical protein